MTAKHDPTCTSCEHDCPWRRTNPAPLGAPFCAICDDHWEAGELPYCGCDAPEFCSCDSTRFQTARGD